MLIGNQEIASIKSLTVLNYGSGDVLSIEFQNGSRLDVTPENDGFHFFRKPDQNDPTISVMTHITGEFQPESDTSVTVQTLGDSGDFDLKLNVFHKHPVIIGEQS